MIKPPRNCPSVFYIVGIVLTTKIYEILFYFLSKPLSFAHRYYILYNEDRYNTIGMVNDILFVVYTERKENIRLISARLATKTEEHLL